MPSLGTDPGAVFADSTLWAVFEDLRSQDEAERREVLRPHEDEYTRDKRVAQSRTDLDAALDALTQAEIWLQCRADAAGATPPLPHRDTMRALLESDSFLRYLNSYLYFGVRMFLRRYIQPDAVVYKDAHGVRINREPWWLGVPPAVRDDSAKSVRVAEDIPADSDDVAAALRFLDGTAGNTLPPMREGSSLGHTLELWIRGLQPELMGDGRGAVLAQIAHGLAEWAERQARFYRVVAGRANSMADTLPQRPPDGWGCDTPVIARVALGDLYWIAALLRTDVTAAARVTNRGVSWLGLLRFRAALYNDTVQQQSLQAAEEILRQVFSICCDLVQNAYEVASLQQQRLAEPLPVAGQRSGSATVQSGAEGWRAVFDRELDEVRRQRDYREYGRGKEKLGVAAAGAERWSRQLYTSDAVPPLVGLAFSGGGIRSATFNLGVLQGLQELDLLRQVDYLSTVSGGGFAGSWLVGNVKRSTYWLGRLTPWDTSIAHLRKFSNYLAPRTGLLSMDTWSLGALWLRNTLLIQLTSLAWLLVLLCAVYLLRLSFHGFAAANATVAEHGLAGVPGWSRALFLGGRLLLACSAVVVVAELAVNLWRGEWRPYYRTLRHAPRSRRTARWWLRASFRLLQRRYILALAVVPAWLGAALLSMQLFASTWRMECPVPLPAPAWTHNASVTCSAAVEPHFSTLFLDVLRNWQAHYKDVAVLLCTFVGLLVLSLLSLLRSRSDASGSRAARVGGACGMALLSTVLVHVCLSGESLLMAVQLQHVHSLSRAVTLAAVWAPGATLLTYALAILLMIGLAGRASDTAQREWWTRYGAAVLVVAAVGMAIPAVTFGSPWLFHWLHHRRWIKWGTVLGWAGTSLGGLFAGKSSRTAGEGATRAPSLQLLANLGGGLFLAGAAMGAAELLYVFLRSETGASPRLGVLEIEAVAGYQTALVTCAVLLGCALVFSWRFDLNVFGLSELYRNRLVRCYLGATRWQTGMRHPENFTQFDFSDDLPFSALAGEDFRGPFPLINCSLNLAGSSDLALHTRHSASFTLSPLFCGAAREHVGYRPTTTFAKDLQLGQAIAVSGAAASPNMGYNTAPLVALLLTLFNVRLGWWFANPGSSRAAHQGPSGLYYLMLELLGLAGEQRAYINVTDGGHFENLGIYELVRRRSQLIIACDAECDETMTFSGLANAIRLCATDFGAVIELDLASLRRGEDGLSRTHSVTGLIRYSNGSVGHILYLKASLTGDEDATVAQYRSSHVTFPHETTANQFFKEEQFESYRRLGHHVLRNTLRNATAREPLLRVAERLMDTATPASSTNETFLEHTRALERLWQHLGADYPKQSQPGGFLMELMGHAPQPAAAPRVDAEITTIGLELLQLMEDVVIALRLDDFWEHPDHRGWALLFMGWARSPRLRLVWAGNHRTFSIGFEHFCATRLGLLRDDPVLRVSPLSRD